MIINYKGVESMKLYKCNTCGNIINFVENSSVPVMCCGQKMEELVPGTSDGASEKHVPIIKNEDGKVIVEVGSVKHPMMEEHYIEWIVLETTAGTYRKNLKPGQEPRVEFVLDKNEKVVAAYEYCNIHGFWEGK